METETKKLTLEGLKSEIIQSDIEKVELFVGVNKEGNLISLEFDLLGMIQQKYISICGSEYDTLISEEKGREEAEERLCDLDYWSDLGYLGNVNNNLFINFIDFDRLAKYVIANDGWENINGEFQEFGTIEGTTYYMNLSGCGQHDFKPSDISKWLVDKSETTKVLKIWKEYHLNSKLAPEIFLKLLKYLIDYVKKHKHFIDRSLVLASAIETIKELQGYDEI